MSTMKFWTLALALLAVLGVFPLLAEKSGAAGQYAGSESCASCHEKQTDTFNASLHGKKGFERRSDKACETCHGPGQEHVKADGDKTKIRSFASLSPNEKSGICLTCHERGARLSWEGSVHDSRGLSCPDCHSMHSAKSEKNQLKTVVETDTCFGCHKQKQSQFLRASHHPLREGKVTCSDCHNPHGVQTGKLLEQSSVNEQCYKCHAEKRGPYLWDHIPVREDCTNCHDPHGSNHPKLLVAKVPFLCQRCHTDGGHRVTLYDQSQINYLNNKILNRSCPNCHSKIHGSNHPSGNTFLR